MNREKRYVGYERLHDWGSRQSIWMQKLIQEITDVQNTLSEEKINELCQSLIDEKNLVELVTPTSQVTNKKKPSQAEVLLKSLKHIKGVNNIKEGEEIKFHERMTICFGENASGKTGYVRMIKKVAESLTQKPILSDINKIKENYLLPEFKALFAVNGEEIEWKERNNEVSNNSISNQISVFDSHVAFWHLSNQLNCAYTPQGIAPFDLAVKTIRRIREELKKQTSQEESSLKNSIKDGFIYDKVIGIKSQEDLDETIKSSKISDDKKSEIAKLIETEKILTSGDVLLHIEQANAKIRILQDTLNIASVVEEFNYESYATASSELIECQRRHKDTTYKAFKNESVPGIFGNHWEKFIEAGEEYIKQEIESEDTYPVSSNDKCVYCRQELQKNAIVLLKKYRNYCNNQSRKAVEAAKNKKREISALVVDLSVDGNKKDIENLKKDIASSTFFSAYFDVAMEIVEFAQTLQEFLRQSLKKEGDNDKVIYLPSNFKESRKVLCNEVDKIRQNIIILNDQKEQRKNDLDKIQRDIQLFAEKKNLNDVLNNSNIINTIKRYIEINRCVKYLQKVQTNLTKELVEANEDMMEQGYKKHFNEECKKLHIKPVEIETHGSEGNVLRNLTTKTNWDKKPDLKDILSEGEQRCIALADFLTEEIFLKEASCLVFDDPVSSVDYNYIDYIAERLVTISRERQIVVFTHDILFAGELIEKLESEHCQDDENREYYLYRIESDISDKNICGLAKRQKRRGHEGLEKTFDERCKEIKTIVQIGKKNNDKDLCTTLAIGGYARLRVACEYLVIQKVIMNTVSPYRKNVRMRSITKIKDVRNATESILPVFDKCCDFLHPKPASKKERSPTIEELEKDLERLEIFVRGKI